MEEATTTEQEQYDDAQETCKRYRCVCGADLVTAWVANRWTIRCRRTLAHREWQPVPSERQAARVAGASLAVSDQPLALVGLPPVETAVALVQSKFDKLDLPSARLFVRQCFETGLNPLYGEAVPLVFTSTKTGKKMVTFFPTRDGWAILAAREEQARYAGPPALRRVMKTEERTELGFEERDFVVQARGRTADGTEFSFTSALLWTEHEAALSGNEFERKLPKAKDPWRMAEARAERLWYKHVFPFAVAKARGKQLMSDALQVEVQELDAVIEAEYSVDGVSGARQPKGKPNPPQSEAPPTGQEAPPGTKATTPLLQPATEEEKADLTKRALAKLQWDLAKCIDMAAERKIVWARMTVGQLKALSMSWGLADSTST